MSAAPKCRARAPDQPDTSSGYAATSLNGISSVNAIPGGWGWGWGGRHGGRGHDWVGVGYRCADVHVQQRCMKGAYIGSVAPLVEQQ